MTSSSVDPLGMSLEEIIEMNKKQNAEGDVSSKSGNANWRHYRSRNRDDMQNRGRSASRGRSRSRGRSASRGRSRSRGRSASRGRSTSRGRNQNISGRGNSTRGRRNNGPNGNGWRNLSRNRNASVNYQNRSRSRSRGNQNRNQSKNRNRSNSRGRNNWVREQSTSPMGRFRGRSSSRKRQNGSQATIYISSNSPLWKRNGKISYNSYKRGQYFVTKFARSRVQLAKRRLGGVLVGRNKRNLAYRTGLRTAPALNNTFRSDYILPRNLKQRWKKGLVQPTLNSNGGYEALTVQIVNDKAMNVNSQQRPGFRGQNQIRRSTSQQSLTQRIGSRSPAQHVVEISPGGSVITTVRQQNGGGSFRQRMRRSVSRGPDGRASQRNFQSKLNPHIQQTIAEIQSRGSANRTNFMDSDESTSIIATPTAKATGVRLSDRFSNL